MRARSGWFAVSIVLAVAGAVAADEDDPLCERARVRLEWDCPKNVDLDSVGVEERTITVHAASQVIQALATFVENVKTDPLFGVPHVTFIREKPDSSPKTYEIQFSFTIVPEATECP